MNTFVAGNTLQLLVSFSESGTFFTPGTVTCQVIGPTSRVILTPTVIEDSVGEYHANVVVNDPGLWSYRWSTTNPASAGEGTFLVRPSVFVA